MGFFVFNGHTMVAIKKTKYNSVYFLKDYYLENMLPKEKHKYIPGIKYIFHFMAMNKIMHFTKKEYDGNVSIYSQHLLKVIGKNYKRCIEIMQELNLIIVNDSYQYPKYATYKIEGKCKTYKFTEWAGQEEREKHIVNGSIAEYLRSKNRDNPLYPLNKVDYHLKKWLSKVKVDVIPKEVWREINVNQRNNIDLIKMQNFRFIKDKNGRRHTNLTNMDSTIRPYLTLGVYHLTGYDFANSQPFFAAWKVCNLVESIVNTNIDSLPDKTIPYVLPNDVLFSLKPCNLRDIQAHDAVLWLKMTQNGVFYEEIMRKCPELRKFGMGEDEFRNSIKKLSLMALYDKWDNGRYVLPITTALFKMFPQSMKLLSEVKKDDYSILANAMQKCESLFIIDVICVDLMNNYPEMPIITIHDSILTTPQYLDILKQVIEKHCALYNVAPTIKKQDWSSDYEKEIQF